MMKAKKYFNKKGYTLIELVVVMMVFSTLAIIIVQALALSLRGARKSESLIQTKENVEYVMGVIERGLRNSRSIVSCTGTQLEYTDYDGTTPNPRFRCVGGANGYIASGPSDLRITSPDIYIDCGSTVFYCTLANGNVPPSVTLNISARDVNSLGAEGALYSSSTKILLRTY